MREGKHALPSGSNETSGTTLSCGDQALLLQPPLSLKGRRKGGVLSLLSFLPIALFLFASLAHAVEPDEILQDPSLEARARALSQELRCVVCQNESIDASSAGIARDLRILVRERILAGDTDEQVLTFVTDRYGDYVLLRPRLSTQTFVLWFGPFILLMAGGAGLAVYLRRRRLAQVDAQEAALSPEEEAEIAALRTRGDQAT